MRAKPVDVVAAEFHHFGNEQKLARDTALGERVFQPLVDQPLMGRVLIDQDHGVRGLGEDVGLVQLRAGGAERAGFQFGIGREGCWSGVGAGSGEAFEWRLHAFGKTGMGIGHRASGIGKVRTLDA